MQKTGLPPSSSSAPRRATHPPKPQNSLSEHIVLEGVGLYQARGGLVEVIRPCDRVFLERARSTGTAPHAGTVQPHIRVCKPTPAEVRTPVSGSFVRIFRLFMRVCAIAKTEWPREESNLRTWIRSPPLYPLSYGAAERGEGWSMGLEPTTTGTTTRGSTN